MKRILVVNDSVELLEMMKTLLQLQGHDTILRSYPLLKLEETEDMKSDLIILDILFGNQQPIGWAMLDCGHSCHYLYSGPQRGPGAANSTSHLKE
jgi:CheY-like chemotaxis protein